MYFSLIYRFHNGRIHIDTYYLIAMPSRYRRSR